MKCKKRLFKLCLIKVINQYYFFSGFLERAKCEDLQEPCCLSRCCWVFWPCPPALPCLGWVYLALSAGLALPGVSIFDPVRRPCLAWGEYIWHCPAGLALPGVSIFDPVRRPCLAWGEYIWPCPPSCLAWGEYIWPCPPALPCLGWVYLILSELSTFPCPPVTSCLRWVRYPVSKDGLFVWSNHLTLSASSVLPEVNNWPWGPGWPVCLK